MNSKDEARRVALPPHEEAAVLALREAMWRAGSAFDFIVQRAPVNAAPPGLELHRAALQALFDSIALRWEGLRFSVPSSDPLPLDALALPGRPASWLERLAQAFDDPPYGLQVDGADARAQLFARFRACTGLEPVRGSEVFDWVGDPDAQPERSAWSNYFDDGREWWGIWCLTVWNPRHRTLAAIAASATD